MLISALFFLLFLSQDPALAASEEKPEIRLVTEENPPFNYTDARSGKFVGMGTEIVEEVFKRAGVSYSITPLPWLRAYNAALRDPNTCVFMTAHTNDRDKLFQWIGPIFKVEWVIYGRQNSPLKISSLDDLKKIKVGGYNGDAAALYLQSKGITLDLVPEDALNPRKLVSGRIDAWVTNSIRGPLLSKAQGLDRLKKLYSVQMLPQAVACNQKTKSATIELLNETLKSLKKEGFLERVTGKYLHSLTP